MTCAAVPGTNAPGCEECKGTGECKNAGCADGVGDEAFLPTGE